MVFVMLVAVSCRGRDEAASTPDPGPSDPTPTVATADTVATDAPVETAPSGSTPAESAPTTTSEPAEPEDGAAPVQNQFGPGDHVVAVRHDGKNRSYIIHVPEALPANAAVMMALHGGGGTGEQFQEENGLDAVADREGFIAIYPEGSGVLPDRLHTWNSGDACCGFATDRDIDDVGFLRAVIEDLQFRMSVDPDRVYVTGHSNGGMMAYRMGAEASDVVAAVISIGGAMDLAEFAPSEPVGVLHIHSVDDPRALYDGGEGPPFPLTDRTVFHEPVMEGIERWAEANGCGPDSTVEQVAEGTGENDGQLAELLVWQNCAASAPVEHLRLSGTGHGWPGVTVGRFWQERMGPATTLVNASEEAWAFANR